MPVDVRLALAARVRSDDDEGAQMSGVLDGVRVLDVTAWQAGPMVTMVLGDFGAEVLKIEAATRLDGWRAAPA